MRLQPLVLSLLIFPSLVLMGCGQPEAQVNKTEASQPVRVLTVNPSVHQQRLQASGLVQPDESVALSFKVGGVIQQLVVDEGQRVNAGQVLARLDATEINAQVAQAQATVDKAQRDLARVQNLHDQGVLAQQPVDDARTQVTLSTANLRAALFNQEHAIITAPSAGVVLHKYAEVRQLVAVGQPILQLGRADQGWNLQVGLADKEAVLVKAGQQVAVVLDSFPQQPIQGQIRRIAASSDAQTGMIPIDIQLNSRLPLVAGMIGRATFTLDNHNQSAQQTYLPLSALLEANHQQAHVFVIEQGRAHRRQVTLGKLLDEQNEVTTGLHTGEQVVVEGAAWLSDGDRVTILP